MFQLNYINYIIYIEEYTVPVILELNVFLMAWRCSFNISDSCCKLSITVFIQRIQMLIQCIPILIGNIPVLIKTISILITIINGILVCHERPLIINYHVLIGQYEISGSQLIGAVSFQSLFVLLEILIWFVSLINGLDQTNYTKRLTPAYVGEFVLLLFFLIFFFKYLCLCCSCHVS